MPSHHDPEAGVPPNNGEAVSSATVGGLPPFPPDYRETLTVDFDGLSRFQPESKATVDEPAESIAFLPDEPSTPLPPALVSAGGPDPDDERAALEEIRAELRRTKTAIDESLGEAVALKVDLKRARQIAVELTRDFNAIKEASRQAHDEREAATAAMRAIEQRLDGLTALHQLSTQTYERLAALNALADEVTQKARLLENQKSLIERTLTGANRVNDMTRSMESQADLLKKGRREAARTEDMLRRIERLAAKTTAQLERATKVKDEQGRELARFEDRAQALTRTIGKQVEQLGVDGATIPSLLQRAGALSLNRRAIDAVTIFITQRRSWAIKHRAHVLGSLVVLALASFFIMRSVEGRIGTDAIPPPAQAALAAPLSARPNVMTEPVMTQTSYLAAEQPAGNAAPAGNVAPARNVGAARVEPGGNVTPAGNATSARSVESQTTPVEPKEFIGTLAIQSDPVGATVFLNSRPVGKTPLQLQRLSAGSYAVWVEREGYERWTQGVQVPAGTLTQVNVKLRHQGAPADADTP